MGSLAKWRELANEPAIAAVRSLSRAVSAADPDSVVHDRPASCPVPPKAATRLSGSPISPDHDLDWGEGDELRVCRLFTAFMHCELQGLPVTTRRLAQFWASVRLHEQALAAGREHRIRERKV